MLPEVCFFSGESDEGDAAVLGHEGVAELVVRGARRRLGEGGGRIIRAVKRVRVRPQRTRARNLFVEEKETLFISKATNVTETSESTSCFLLKVLENLTGRTKYEAE